MFRERISDDKIKEIVELLASGSTQQETANQLGVALSTVSKYSRVGKKPKTVGSPKDYETLRQLISDVIRDDFCSLKEEKNNEDKEEKEMGDEVGTKVQEALDRKAMLDRLNELSSLKGDIEAIKANQDGISDLCKRFPGLCEQVEKLEKGFEANIASVKTLCDQFPGLCSTQESIQASLRKKEDAKDTVLGTGLKLDELLKHEGSQKVLADKYMGDFGLLRALERCTGPECEILRQKAREKGINLQVKTKGAMPGSMSWKDVD